MPKGIRKTSMRKKRSLRKRRVVKKSGTPTKALTKLIQRVVSRNIENKSRQANHQMNLLYPSPGKNYIWYGLIPLTPYESTGAPADSTVTIVQGTGAGSRVGNTIRTKYCTFKGVLVPYPKSDENNPSPAPIEVCLWIFKLKNLSLGNKLIDALNIINTTFFQSSNSTSAVTGDLINIIQAINSDDVMLLYKRIFKIGYAAGIDSGNTSNNDFAYNRKFSINITKFLPKVIKYNDNDDDPSINHTYALMLPFKADGSVDTGNHVAATCDWEINYVYEDA